MLKNLSTRFPAMSHKQIYYSDKYDDDKYEYRFVWLMLFQHAFEFCQIVNIIL